MSKSEQSKKSQNSNCVLAWYYRQDVEEEVKRLIRVCNMCGSNALAVQSAAEQLLIELEEYKKQFGDGHNV